MTGSREQGDVPGRLVNRVRDVPGQGLRLECSTHRDRAQPTGGRPDIRFEDFEIGYDRWTVSGDAFRSDGKPYRHDQPLQNVQGKLGVSNRQQAVARAVSLGIIEPQFSQ